MLYDPKVLSKTIRLEKKKKTAKAGGQKKQKKKRLNVTEHSNITYITPALKTNLHAILCLTLCSFGNQMM